MAADKRAVAVTRALIFKCAREIAPAAKLCDLRGAGTAYGVILEDDIHQQTWAEE